MNRRESVERHLWATRREARRATHASPLRCMTVDLRLRCSGNGLRPPGRSLFPGFLGSCLILAVLCALCVSAVTMNQAMAGPLEGIEGIYDGPEGLAKAAGPVVVILDTEHPDRIREELAKDTKLPYKCVQLKKKLEKIAGVPCVLVHYSQVTRKEMGNERIKAVFISARSKMMTKEMDDELFAFIRETRIPTLGSCGGCELIVQAYGGKIGKMRDLMPGEKDPNPAYWPGTFKEWGFQKIRVVKKDPIFDGLPDEPVVREFHSWEITALPDCFEVLASTDECKVEAMRHKEKAMYGTQFHAELFDDKHMDGKIILKNFFKIAGIRITAEN